MDTQVLIFSDYVCPYCYIGKGIIEELEKEFDIQVTWAGFELHQETPIEGVEIAQAFPGIDMESFLEKLGRLAEPYGLTFGKVSKISNTRLALQASEFARDHGKYDEFHRRTFRAYFEELKDVGNLDVIMDLASEVGLDEKELRQALADERYVPRLNKSRKDAMRFGISSIPAFIFNEGKSKIIGAKPIQVFRDTIEKLSEG